MGAASDGTHEPPGECGAGIGRRCDGSRRLAGRVVDPGLRAARRSAKASRWHAVWLVVGERASPCLIRRNAFS